MTIQERVPLAPRTTLNVGGVARFFVSVSSEAEITAALSEAKRRGEGVAVLGSGSNVLIPDEGVEGLVVHIAVPNVAFAEEGDTALLVAGAGVAWDTLVAAATAAGLWGIENLAGIPGTAGAAPVQNIGAYGAELSDTFEWVEAVDRATGETVRMSAPDAALGYRDSAFKRIGRWVIARVALRLARTGSPRTLYKDFALSRERGEPLSTPSHIADAVRRIRRAKFPDPSSGEGTAGSFFKNPLLARKDYAALLERFPGMPGFEVGDTVKVPLAWILDKALLLRGFSYGTVRLYEKQPLVLVASRTAHAADIDACALDVARRVYDATGIAIEREVRTLVAS